MRPMAVTSAVLIGVGGIFLNSPAAGADVRDGVCTTEAGVTLVVDFQELGGAASCVASRTSIRAPPGCRSCRPPG
ncbi:hypothetical protein G7085_17910 [Tessaracoccus sp. HDW20]|uniref:hypothetical protein n=1 Tax=Tessaracoccus coleopterorum TaxID=2714950 RepID=UPI0018D469E9|nr:hypothetical protein [Tessaracoccus coleopterorum]NHB85807.1 hypothetical protein [Tessaracoccus coleopterorum]